MRYARVQMGSVAWVRLDCQSELDLSGLRGHEVFSDKGNERAGKQAAGEKAQIGATLFVHSCHSFFLQRPLRVLPPGGRGVTIRNGGVCCLPQNPPLGTS